MQSSKLTYGMVCLLVLFFMAFITSCGNNKASEIDVHHQQPYGAYLTNSHGKSVYLFLKDSNGISKCYNQCAEAWPPVLTQYETITAGKKIQESKLGTIKRKNGKMQVTYYGHPLYYYEEDQQPGDVKGQDKMEYGAEWYLVKPNGNKMGDVE